MSWVKQFTHRTLHRRLVRTHRRSSPGGWYIPPGRFRSTLFPEPSWTAASGLNHVVKTTCFLTDMNHFQEFNAVYANYFPGKPARSCVAVRQLPKGVLVEVEAIAEVSAER